MTLDTPTGTSPRRVGAYDRCCGADGIRFRALGQTGQAHISEGSQFRIGHRIMGGESCSAAGQISR